MIHQYLWNSIIIRITQSSRKRSLFVGYVLESDICWKEFLNLNYNKAMKHTISKVNEVTLFESDETPSPVVLEVGASSLVQTNFTYRNTTQKHR